MNPCKFNDTKRDISRSFLLLVRLGFSTNFPARLFLAHSYELPLDTQAQKFTSICSNRLIRRESNLVVHFHSYRFHHLMHTLKLIKRRAKWSIEPSIFRTTSQEPQRILEFLNALQFSPYSSNSTPFCRINTFHAFYFMFCLWIASFTAKNIWNS